MDIEHGLIGHWMFDRDCEESCGRGYRATVTDVEIETVPSRGGLEKAARFNGISSSIEIDDHPQLNLASGDLSVAAWIHTDALAGDVVGDIVNKFDPATRRGFHLGVVTNTGVTTTAQANYRNVHFGIDAGYLAPEWSDCGRPGEAMHIMALAVSKGNLYAGTFEREAHQTGHLYRYVADGQWTDCGACPDGSNGVTSIVEFSGALYCGSGRYNPIGSRLGAALNQSPGGRVYRIDPDNQWIDCGQPGGADAVPESRQVTGYETGKADEATSLTVYRGELYATSHHRRGAFKYVGGQEWQYLGPDLRIMTFTVYRDRLYALVNGGPVYRYEGGCEWTDCGTPGKSDQTYAAATYRGSLYVGTWPECEVQRYDGEQSWANMGRVGYEREVMAMALYNAKVYLGTLPMANVWRMDDDGYAYIGNLDNTPSAYLRRVWSMAVFQGKLFAGTLPSGHVRSVEAGRMATSDGALAPGWRHLIAVREGKALKLYVDGELAAESSPFEAAEFNLSNSQPLKIGFGVHDYFRGALSDLRLYDRALSAAEARQLGRPE